MDRSIPIEIVRGALARLYTAAPLACVAMGAASSAWQISGRCRRPKSVTLIGRPLRKPGQLWQLVPQTGMPYFMDMEVACRGCPECLSRRAQVWKRRALAEWVSSPRTWLVTMTFHPHRHMEFLCAGMAEAGRQGVRWSDLSPDEQYRRLAREAGKDVQKYLKRVRKQTGTRFRYMVVSEPHKSGKPHFHMLLHEISAWGSVGERDLRLNWRGGFIRAKLVRDPAGAGYAAKYLAKEKGARVRASLRYGQPPEAQVMATATSGSRQNVKTYAPQPPEDPSEWGIWEGETPTDQMDLTHGTDLISRTCRAAARGAFASLPGKAPPDDEPIPWP